MAIRLNYVHFSDYTTSFRYSTRRASAGCYRDILVAKVGIRLSYRTFSVDEPDDCVDPEMTSRSVSGNVARNPAAQPHIYIMIFEKGL